MTVLATTLGIALVAALGCCTAGDILLQPIKRVTGATKSRAIAAWRIGLNSIISLWVNKKSVADNKRWLNFGF